MRELSEHKQHVISLIVMQNKCEEEINYKILFW